MKIKFILVVLIVAIGCSSVKNDKLKYIESDKPLEVPKVFAPGFISTESGNEYGSIFTKNGNEFYYAVDKNKKSEIRYTKIRNGKWDEPITIISHEKYSYNDPFLSPNEDKLYYISDMPKNETDTIRDFDIWYSLKTEDKWSAPIHGGDNINSDKNEYYISFTSTGKIYFASNVGASLKRKHDFDIFSSVYENGEFQKPIKLSESINSGRYEADVFISPDESYIIYCTARRDGFGNGDLYISFKNGNGEWSKSKNMGDIINSENHELCPFVTIDGQYLFYTSNSDIYWVSSKIIDTYR